MKTINKNWLWVIGGLLLLNVSLLAFIWIKKPDHKPPPFLEEKLAFTADQQQQFEKLRNSHMREMDRLRKDIDALRDELYGTSGSSDEKVREITTQLGNKKAEGDLLTYRHFQEVRAICTPEQQQEFDKLINEIVRGMNGRPIPPQGERGGQGRGDGPPEGRRPPPGERLPPP